MIELNFGILGIEAPGIDMKRKVYERAKLPWGRGIGVNFWEMGRTLFHVCYSS